LSRSTGGTPQAE